MNIVIALDSFKGSLSSLDAGNAVNTGIKRVLPQARTQIFPLADGGEGTVSALTLGMGGHLETVTVCGPLSQPVAATYGILSDQKTAILEMASAAGITLLKRSELDPMSATTFGIGELLRSAIQKGCRNFIIGIGGSATNDGGAGMLQALGYGLFTSDHRPIAPGCRGLSELAYITTDQVLPELDDCRFQIACDVTNPLCGPNGCSAIFGPQKGATKDMISQMDTWLASYSALAAACYPNADADFPGSGAAGGLGFAFHTFLHADLRSGIEIILQECKIEDAIALSDLVVTGEGCLDGQTAMGKAPVGVATLAKKYHKKVIAFSGCVTEDASNCNQHGIDAFFPILRNVTTLEQAMSPSVASANLSATAEQVFRLIQCFL